MPWPRSSPSLKGPDGRIRIPGFYDDVVPLSDADRAALAELPFDEAEYQQKLGLPALVGEVGYTTLERRAIRPTLDVNGLWGGFAGRWDQDDHPRPRPCQGQLPAGGRPGSGPDLRGVQSRTSRR